MKYQITAEITLENTEGFAQTFEALDQDSQYAAMQVLGMALLGTLRRDYPHFENVQVTQLAVADGRSEEQAILKSLLDVLAELEAEAAAAGDTQPAEEGQSSEVIPDGVPDVEYGDEDAEGVLRDED